MGKAESLLLWAEKQGGIITAKTAKEKGISGGVLSYLVRQGKLEKTAVGVYQLPGKWEDEYFQLQYRFSKGVFSYLSALSLHRLTDVNPTHYSLTFKQGYNTKSPSAEGVECHIATKENFEIGLVVLKSPSGQDIRCYSAERTLCDIVNPKYHTDVRVIADAYKAYAKRKDKNIGLLMQYADLFHVSKTVRKYMEVLL